MQPLLRALIVDAAYPLVSTESIVVKTLSIHALAEDLLGLSHELQC